MRNALYPIFAWSHAEDQRGESLILGGLLHPVAASLVLLVSTRPTLALCVRTTQIQRGQEVHKRWTVQPPHAFCRDRTIAHYFVMSAIVCAYNVFDFVECFRFYLHHSLLPKHVTAPHPVRQDVANPTRAGCRYALDREIPLLAFVGRIPRTGFAGCCGRPSGICLRQMV